MKHTLFGTYLGEDVVKYTLTNGSIEADIITLGATITAVRVPDKSGKLTDVVLGHPTLEDYLTKGGYLGAVIGRYGNRIENGQFVINGKTYQVGVNEAPNSLHGGLEGFDKKIWKAVPQGDNALTLTYHSPDGEEGFPGNLDVTVTYTVTADNGLSISYRAVSDADTTVNLTNHAYFNVRGTENTTDGILLRIAADQITPVDEALIPHNTFRDVGGSLYDFRSPRPFICDLSGDETLSKRGCYDENFVLSGSGMRNVSSLLARDTGIQMDVYTDQPGMQIYTGNPGGIALETQNFPNAINCPAYPNAILRAGDIYETTTAYVFTTI